MNEKASWRSPALGEAREIDLPQGTIRVHETGAGEPIVFVHGLLVNANLWRKVVPALAGDFRCIALDMPLGSHLRPMPKDADLSPYGLADLVADAIEALGLEDVTLVGNDTGGAISQIVATPRPERIGRLVLTPCDAFDVFPPAIFKWALAPAQIPALVPLVFAPLRLRAPRRLPFAFGWLAKRPIDRDAEDSYVLPPLSDAGVRRDVPRPFGAWTPSTRSRRPRSCATSARPRCWPGRARTASSRPSTPSGWPRSSPTPASSGSTTPTRSSPRTSPAGWPS